MTCGPTNCVSTGTWFHSLRARGPSVNQSKTILSFFYQNFIYTTEYISGLNARGSIYQTTQGEVEIIQGKCIN